MTFKILIDASITSKGGGVQVALSFIENIAKDPDFEIICVVNPEIDKQLSSQIKNNIKNYYIETIEPIYSIYYINYLVLSNIFLINIIT